MKVLLYHPIVHAEHPWVKKLQEKGHGVLWCTSFDEAIKLATAHAKSLDLFISHREDESGKEDIGFKRIPEIRKIKDLSDLPWIGTTGKLNEKELATHQDTAAGANAYLRDPFNPSQLLGLVDTVMGTGDGTQFVLEESPFAQSEPSASTTLSTSGIHLDLPNLDDFDLDASEMSTESENQEVVETQQENKFNPAEPIELSQIIERPIELSSTQDQTGQLQAPQVPTEKPAIPPPFAKKPTEITKEIVIEPITVEPITDEPNVSELELSELELSDLELAESQSNNAESSFLIEGIETLEGQPEPTELNWSPEVNNPSEPSPNEPNELSMIEFTSMLNEPIHTDSAQNSAQTPTQPPGSPTQIIPSFEAGITLNNSLFGANPLEAEAAETELPPLEESELPGSELSLTPAPAAPTNAETVDSESESAMSYLFQKPPGRDSRRPVEIASVSAETAFAQPVGDAVVPGGAAQAPDLETLKQYLLLREQDVGVLSSQLRSAKQQIQNLEKLLEMESAKNTEVCYQLEHNQTKLNEFENQKEKELDELRSEVSDLKFQIKARADKIRGLETGMRDSADELNQIRERVKSDIRKIRVREKELENRLEIIKKDSEALIVARENKIIELKRKIDLLEFNLDIIQERYHQEKQHGAILKEKLGKAAQIVRAAGGLLDHSEISSASVVENKYKAS